LDVLIGSAATMEGQRLEEIPVKDIRPNPRQPRIRFDEEALEQMARSIEAFGVVQPIVVRTVGTDYELVAGERRWRAAQEAGLDKIPAIVKQTTETDSLEMALIENLHRSDLNGIEEAHAFQQLLDDFAITHEELSRRVGKSRATISNTLRLIQLPARIKKEVMEGRITTGHARALLALQEQPELQDRLCSQVIAEGLSVRQTEEMAGLGGEGAAAAAVEKPGASNEKAALPGEVLEIFSSLGELLDARVKGSLGKRKGKLIIEFRDVDDLRRIFANITGPWEAGSDSEGPVSDEASGTGVEEPSSFQGSTGASTGAGVEVAENIAVEDRPAGAQAALEQELAEPRMESPSSWESEVEADGARKPSSQKPLNHWGGTSAPPT
jgi:ParB family transcriptional regulator, chromosome partitioning protein